MKNKKIFLIGLIYFMSMLAVASIFILGSFGLIENDLLSSLLIQVMSMFAIPLLMYSIFISKSVSKTFKDFGFRKINFKMIVISFTLGILLYIINTYVAGISQSIIQLLGYESLSFSSGSTTAVTYQMFFKDLVLSCIFPAIFEEFTHRGLLLFSTKKRTNIKYSLFISSILFGLMHMNINQFFYASILGFMMGYVAIVSDSIFPAMIIHFSNNFISTFLTYGTYFKWKSVEFIDMLIESFFTNLTSTLLTMFAILGGCICLYLVLTRTLHKERLKLDTKKLNKLFERYLASNEQYKMYSLKLTQQLNANKKLKSNRKAPCFTENVFYISCIILGGLVTISSFLWGIL